MIIDKQLELSLAQALTTTAASTNYIDQGAPGESVNNELYLLVKTNAALTGGTSVTIDLQCDDNTSFSSPTTLFSTGAILTAALTANKTLVKVRVPSGAERYIRVNYTIVGTYSAGTVDAYLVKNVQVN